jgi:hypothetical protein
MGMLKRVAATFAIGSVSLLVACGDGSNESARTFQRAIPIERNLSIDDFLAVGVKKGREHDVTGLTGASSAFIVFFGPNPSERKDYELRIYPSHDVAVRDGTALAEEGVGEGMKAKKDNQTWKEGARERWFAGGVTDISSAGSRQSPGPKFWDYVIYGNVVMLCQGLDSRQSLETCSALIEALGGQKLFE